MRSKVVLALVALNAVLLACLVGQWVRPTTAQAQLARPSDYILIPGTVQASPTQVVYVIDTQNGWLSARMFAGQQMTDMRPIDLNRIFAQGGTGGNVPRRGAGPGR